MLVTDGIYCISSL